MVVQDVKRYVSFLSSSWTSSAELTLASGQNVPSFRASGLVVVRGVLHTSNPQPTRKKSQAGVTGCGVEPASDISASDFFTLREDSIDFCFWSTPGLVPNQTIWEIEEGVAAYVVSCSPRPFSFSFSFWTDILDSAPDLGMGLVYSLPIPSQLSR